MPEKPGAAERQATPLPWPKEPPPGWPPEAPWPPIFAAGQKKCIEACMATGVPLHLCAIACAILDGVDPFATKPPAPAGAPPAPPLPPTVGDGLARAIQAIDDEIILELKQVAQHRANAIRELQNAASNRQQGNDQVADALTRSADPQNARANEIEIEIRGKERAKARVQGVK